MAQAFRPGALAVGAVPQGASSCRCHAQPALAVHRPVQGSRARRESQLRAEIGPARDGSGAHATHTSCSRRRQCQPQAALPAVPHVHGSHHSEAGLPLHLRWFPRLNADGLNTSAGVSLSGIQPALGLPHDAGRPPLGLLDAALDRCCSVRPRRRSGGRVWGASAGCTPVCVVGRRSDLLSRVGLSLRRRQHRVRAPALDGPKTMHAA